MNKSKRKLESNYLSKRNLAVIVLFKIITARPRQTYNKVYVYGK